MTSRFPNQPGSDLLSDHAGVDALVRDLDIGPARDRNPYRVSVGTHLLQKTMKTWPFSVSDPLGSKTAYVLDSFRRRQF